MTDMSNVIDISERLLSRNLDNLNREVGIKTRQIVEELLSWEPWPTIFTGLTNMPGVADWSDLLWTTLELDMDTVQDGCIFHFQTNLRNRAIPGFGYQNDTEFLTVDVRLPADIVDTPVADDNDKLALKQAFLDYANSFSQIPSTKFAFQLGLLSNVLDNNPVQILQSDLDSGKLKISLSIPLGRDQAPFRAELILTFAFLPLVLDHLAVNYANQQDD